MSPLITAGPTLIPSRVRGYAGLFVALLFYLLQLAKEIYFSIIRYDEHQSLH